MPEWTLLPLDCRQAMRLCMAPESVDSVVTDPPYDLTSIVKRFGAGNAAPCQFGSDGAFRRASRGFMGQQWDGTAVAFDPDTWREVYRVLKPGGHLFAFGGTRTYHRMVCAIEDAGFEIRDQFGWCFGSGFPKSHDVSKAIDRMAGAEREVIRSIPDRWTGAQRWAGWGTAVKPAWEPIVLARKPLIGSVARNVLAHGTGALNIDACRIEGTVPTTFRGQNALGQSIGWNKVNLRAPQIVEPHMLGRFPANLAHDGSDEVLACFPGKAGAAAPVRGDEPSDVTNGIYNARDRVSGAFYGDSGSAARFFYCAKASKADRSAGLDSQRIVSLEYQTWDNADQKVALRVDMAQSRLRVIGVSGIACGEVIEWNSALFGNAILGQSLPDMTSTTETEINSIILSIIWSCFQRFGTSVSMEDASKSTESGKNPAENADDGFQKIIITDARMESLLGVDRAASKTLLKISVKDGASSHPTVKPTALMEWLVRLVTPPGGLVLDPFTGSGSTGKAALRQGFSFVGCEMTPEYIPIAEARLAHALAYYESLRP